MKKRHYHFEKRTVISFILYLVLVTLLLSIMFNALYVKEQRSMLAIKENEVMNVSAQVDNFLVESIDTVNMAAYTVNSMIENGASDETIVDYLEEQTKAYAKTVSSDFTGVYGAIRGKYLDGSRWTPPEDYEVKDRPWYHAAQEANGEVTLVTPYLDTKTGTIKMSVSKLLTDRDSVISMDVTMNEIQDIVEESIADGGWLQSMILDAHGIVVAHSDTDEIAKQYSAEDDSLGKKVVKELEVNENAYFSMTYGGKKYYVFSDSILNDWQAVTILESYEIMDSLNRISLMFCIVLLLIWGALLFTFLKLSELRGRQLNLGNLLRSVIGTYEMIWYLDLAKDVYFEAGREPGNAFLGNVEKKQAQYALRCFMDENTDERFKKSAFAFVDLSTLPRRMKGKSFVELEFLDTANGKRRVRFIPERWDEAGELTEVTWLMEVTEERTE